MALIMWTPDLAVGIAKIDDQHQQLFKAADDLAEAMWAGKGRQEVEKTIDFLADYTLYHFRDEETVMMENQFPGYSVQKQAHEQFTQEITRLRQRFSSEEGGTAMAIEVLSGACNWLRDHIKTMDKALGDYLQKRAT